VVCDGRAHDEAGLTLAELADALVELGADEAINLDGGGSASLLPARGARRADPRRAPDCDRDRVPSRLTGSRWSVEALSSWDMERDGPGSDRENFGQANLGEAQSSNPPDDPEMIEPDADPLDTDVEDADLFLGLEDSDQE
jgi:hypothetical protein